MTFEEVKKDYLKLVNKYGEPYDMTGGFVDAERMIKVILNPTKENAKRYLMEVIVYGFQFGDYYLSETNGAIYPCDCPIVKEMHEKYCL